MRSNTFGADADEDVTDWGQENVEEKLRAERQPAPDQIQRAYLRWLSTKASCCESREHYFAENWPALPGLKKFVEDEIAADAAKNNT